jgi:excisionase family DNA binding protein
VQEETSSEWITYEDAQRLTSLGRTTLWRICSAEDSGIEVARVGRAVRISRSSLTAYMKRSAEASRSS